MPPWLIDDCYCSSRQSAFCFNYFCCDVWFFALLSLLWTMMLLRCTARTASSCGCPRFASVIGLFSVFFGQPRKLIHQDSTNFMSHQGSKEFRCLKSKYAPLMLDLFITPEYSTAIFLEYSSTCFKMMMIHSIFLTKRENPKTEVDATLTMIVLTVPLPLITPDKIAEY